MKPFEGFNILVKYMYKHIQQVGIKTMWTVAGYT